jgi:flagellar basal body L-ring protein FlgH
MSDTTAKASTQPKKRTTYKAGNETDFPQNLDWSNYSYKWRSIERISALTDGYDPKHWELYKDKDGKTIKRGDLILVQMPIDLYRSMQDQKEENRRSAAALLVQAQNAQQDRDEHEFRKKGGKIKFEFKQE